MKLIIFEKHSNRDIMTLHLGNFGCKVGFCVWKLFCKEHGVLFDGTLDPNFKNEEAFFCCFNKFLYNWFFSRKTEKKNRLFEYILGIPRTVFLSSNIRKLITD